MQAKGKYSTAGLGTFTFISISSPSASARLMGRPLQRLSPPLPDPPIQYLRRSSVYSSG